jgi:thiol-disulfide isomerase/thioredoxin
MVAAETTALGLLVPSGTAGLGLALSAVIVWGYGVAIARLSSAGIRVPCRCFGTAGRPLGSVHIVRNGLIGLIATAAAVLVVMGQGPMPPVIVRVSSVLLGVVTGLLIIRFEDVLAVAGKLANADRSGSASAGPAEAGTDGLPAVASRLADVSATTTDGASFCADDLTGATLLGFFMSDCPPCKEVLPSFAAYARTFPGGRDRVFAVVIIISTTDEPPESLSDVAQVIVEPLAGPVCRALDVHDYPAVCVLNGRDVIFSAFDLDPLTAGLPRS